MICGGLVFILRRQLVMWHRVAYTHCMHDLFVSELIIHALMCV